MNDVTLTSTLQRGDNGWCEMAFRAGSSVLAIIEHPFNGAKWLVYTYGGAYPKTRLFRTKRGALDWISANIGSHGI